MVDNNLTPAEVLRRAADHMEKVGMTKHQFFDWGEWPPDDYKDQAILPCCARGAIRVVAGLCSSGSYKSHTFTLIDQATNCLAKHCPPVANGLESVSYFNDRPDTTKEMMVALMRKAADDCTCGDADAGGK